MPFVKVGSENSAEIEIHYNDRGAGTPVILIHGYPLDAGSWERQEHWLLAEGYRVISYDHRTDKLAPELIGDGALNASLNVAAAASPYASWACIDTWAEHFRADLPKIDVPTLVVHGTEDRILPFEVTAARLRDEQLIADLRVVAVAGGPHNIGRTQPDEVTAALSPLPRRRGRR